VSDCANDGYEIVVPLGFEPEGACRNDGEADEYNDKQTWTENRMKRTATAIPRFSPQANFARLLSPSSSNAYLADLVLASNLRHVSENDFKCDNDGSEKNSDREAASFSRPLKSKKGRSKATASGLWRSMVELSPEYVFCWAKRKNVAVQL
jgi:hypothetical protein